MRNVFLTGLFLFLAGFFWSGGMHGAYAAANHVVIPSSLNEALSVGEFVYVTSDPNGELNVQDIVQRWKNNVKGQRNKDEYIKLPLKSEPFWLAFEIRNQSNNSDFILDFGSIYTGKAGLINKLLIYEGESRKILLDGLTVAETYEDKLKIASTQLAVDIAPKKRAIFVLYVVPDDSYPLVLKPSIISGDYQKISNLGLFEDQTLFPALYIAVIALMLIGFVYNQYTGLLPFILFHVLGLFTFYYIDLPLYSQFMGTGTIASVLILIEGFLILLACYFSVQVKDGISTMKTIVVFTIGLNLLGLIFIAIILQPGVLLRPYCAYGLLFLNMIVGLVFLSTNMDNKQRSPIFYLAMWISLHFVGMAIHIMAGADILPAYTLFVNAPYFMLFPQSVFIFMAVMEILRADSRKQIDEIIRKARKAQMLLKAKQSKEASDQSRLLRVIEREREIMEELRGREAERTEEMRLAKESADEANNAKSAFLAVVSHEIRTPMTGIMGMMRLMENTDLSPEQKEYADTIKDSADAMLALLNDILDFSKIEGGGMELEIIDFELRRVLKGVIMLMSGHADQKDISLILDVADDVPDYLQGDPTRLRQIFLNLVGNALKFTDKGHVKITVSVDPDVQGHYPSNNMYGIYFGVEDTGIGISEEAQKKLFTPFAQADSTIARKYGGTGLGLTICRRLVEAMGSVIKISSRESKGSCFYFSILMRSTSSYTVAEMHNPAPMASTVKPLKILVVDDNAVNRKVIGGLLARDKHEVIYATNGEEALTAIRQNSNDALDCVLMDIELPDIKGTEVTSIVRDEMGKRNLPIIALTGNIGAADLETYIQAGMNDCLAKPIDPEKLSNVMQKLDFYTSQHLPLAPEKPVEEKVEAAPTEKVDNNDDTAKANNTAEKPLADDVLTNDMNEADPFPVDDIKVPEEILKMDGDAFDQAGAPQTSHVVQLLDEGMLRGLRDGLGVEQTKQLIVDLFEKSDEIIVNMRVACEKQNASDLKDRAHELKGMAANFGLSGLSNNAGEIEKICAAENPDLSEVKDYIEILESVNERSKMAVDQFLEK